MQKVIDQGYGKEFAEQMFSVLPDWSFFPVLLLGALGAYLGCTISIKMLKKHFSQSGMA